MAKKTPAPNRKLKEQLNVRVPGELLRRVNAVAGASGKTLANFVIDTLEERTKEHKGDVDNIAAREKVPKRWQ